MLRLEIPDSSGQASSNIDETYSKLMISYHPKWVKLTSLLTFRQTALHVASEYGKANSMAALLEWGADVDAQET